MRKHGIYGLAVLVIALGLYREALAFHEIGSYAIGSAVGVNDMWENLLADLTKQEEIMDIENDKAERGGEEGEPEGKGLAQQIFEHGAGRDFLGNRIEEIKSGNFNPQNIVQNLLEGAEADLTKLGKDELAKVEQNLFTVYDDLQQQLADIKAEEEAAIESEKNERTDKLKAIEARILELETGLAVMNKDSDLAFKTQMELDDLKRQKQQVIEGAEENSETVETSKAQDDKPENGVKKTADAIKQKYANIRNDLADKKAELEEKLAECLASVKKIDMAASLEEKVDKGIEDIFGEEEQQETENLYQEIIEEFFLGEDEISSPENVSRIRQNRRRAYYLAVQDLFVAAVQADGAVWQAGEDAVAMRKALNEKAETNFGAKVMQLGVAMQEVKNAARLTRMMLADMRMETMEQIQNWSTYDRMKDYSQDVTEFNLDNYIYDPSLAGRLKTKVNQGLKNLRNQAVQTGKQAVQGVQNQLGNQLGQINLSQ